MSACVCNFSSSSNVLPAYNYTSRSHYLLSLLYLYSELRNDSKSFGEFVKAMTGSSGAGIMYEKMCIREFVVLRHFQLNSYKKGKGSQSVHFEAAPISSNYNIRNFTCLSTFARPTSWLIPSIPNFATIDLLGMSDSHDIVAIQNYELIS